MENERNGMSGWYTYRMRRDGKRQIKEEYERFRDELRGHLNREKAKLAGYNGMVADANFGASATWDFEKHMRKGIDARNMYRRQKALVDEMSKKYKAKTGIAKVNLEKYLGELKADPFSVYKPDASQKYLQSVLERRLYH